MNGIKPDPDVKMEHDALTPSGSGYMDDDFYEDTGELAMPPKGQQKDIWLTRIPDWLYEKISSWDELAEGNDDDQIVLGEVLAFPDPQGGISKTKPMRMFFDERWRQKAQLPFAFELQPVATKDEVLKNTYVFTEKDLPGFKPSGFGFNKFGAGSFGSGVQDPKARIQKRTKYRKAIPKQTSLVGSSTRSYHAVPLNTKEFIAFNEARTKQAIQGTNSRTNIVDNMNEHNELEKTTRMFNNFVKPAARKSQLNKHARIAKNDLIDQLHAAFDEYAYWPMRSLKQRTQQPEAYLKEVLTDIAYLVKSGSFASCWHRLAMYDDRAAGSEQIAPEAPELGDSDDEEQMEDVV